MNPTVETNYGKLQGGYNKRNNYHYFMGVPYAKPPVGDLRFKAPVRPEKWSGIRSATAHGNRSVSRLTSGRIMGDEDCLYLNVYTKQLPNEQTTLKPVMFWIHGGGFISGSGNTELFGPEYFLEDDVVLVTINYRLGLLGFLVIDEPTLGISGNAGLKDMVMALRWVNENIERFNGDPNNVTVFGESAGGAAAHLLMLSPMTKGLFHRIIAQSGTAISPWALCIRRTKKFANAIQPGADTKTDAELSELFKRQTTEKLIEAVEKVRALNDKKTFRVIGPIIESKTGDDEKFLTENPLDILKSGNFHHVPLILGYNTADAMIYLSKTFGDITLPVNFTDLQDAVPYHLNIPRDTELCKRVGAKIKERYYGTMAPSELLKRNYIQLQTDLKFATVTEYYLNIHKKHSNAPVYFYVFAFDSPANLYKKFYDLAHLKGAAHGDELTYMFTTSYHDQIRAGTKEDRFRKQLVRMWTSFAKSGDPNNSLVNVTWEPIVGLDSNLKHLVIDEVMAMNDFQPGGDVVDFWHEIYDEVNFVM